MKAGLPNIHGVPDWSTVQGVTFPTNSCFHARTKKEIAIDYDAKDWMTTTEVTKLFGSSGSAVRIFLHRKKVKNLMVQRQGEPRCKVWNREHVMRLLEKRERTVKNKVPAGYIPTEEVIKLLGCSRSSIYRYEEHGFLHPIKVMIQKSKRIRKYYEIAELERFKVKNDEIEIARQQYMNLIQKRKGGSNE